MSSWVDRTKVIGMLFSTLAVALSGLLYWEWDQGRALEQRLLQLKTVNPTPIATVAVLPEFLLPDAESGFPELVSRSLFNPGRRSSGASVKGGRSAMKKGQFVLVGVMVTPRQNSALLRDIQTNKTETVAQSGTIRGMTLSEVSATQVVLRQGADFEELPLNVQIGPKGAAPPPSSPVAPSPLPTPVARPASAPASAPVSPKPAEGASAPKSPPPNPAAR